MDGSHYAGAASAGGSRPTHGRGRRWWRGCLHRCVGSGAEPPAPPDSHRVHMRVLVAGFGSSLQSSGGERLPQRRHRRLLPRCWYISRSHSPRRRLHKSALPGIACSAPQARYPPVDHSPRRGRSMPQPLRFPTRREVCTSEPGDGAIVVLGRGLPHEGAPHHTRRSCEHTHGRPRFPTIC